MCRTACICGADWVEKKGVREFEAREEAVWKGRNNEARKGIAAVF